MAVLTIERTFRASPERLFAYLTRTELLLKWWGPEGTTVAEHNLDLSRTGPWWFVLVDPRGGRHRVSGEVLEVDAPRSVKFTLVVEGPGGRAAIDSVVRFDVYPAADGGTRFVLTQSGLTTDQMAAASKMGWVSTLARLEQSLVLAETEMEEE